MLNNIPMSLKCTNGTITVYNDKVVVSRKGLFAFASQGAAGDRIYYYKDLKTVEYKKPGMINGYIKFIIEGTNDINASVNLFSSKKESLQDPNTVILRAFNSKVPMESEKIYNFIMERISQTKNIGTQSNLSAADEIKKFKELLDNKIITQEEFDKKKNELLNSI